MGPGRHPLPVEARTQGRVRAAHGKSVCERCVAGAAPDAAPFESIDATAPLSRLLRRLSLGWDSVWMRIDVPDRSRAVRNRCRWLALLACVLEGVLLLAPP